MAEGAGRPGRTPRQRTLSLRDAGLRARLHGQLSVRTALRTTAASGTQAAADSTDRGAARQPGSGRLGGASGLRVRVGRLDTAQRLQLEPELFAHGVRQWRLDQAQLSWLDAHNAAFRAIGGVPWSVRFDNCKTAVASKGGPWAVLHPAYHSYAEQLGFAMEAADEHRRTVARPRRGRVPGTRNAIDAAPVGGDREPPPIGTNTGRAGCGESRTSGSEGGPQKPIRCETNRALWSDPTLLYPDIPMQRGFLYLVAVMDWATRTVLSWRLSNTLDTAFCREALQEALTGYGRPEIFNTDQGSQFTSRNSPRFLSRPG